MFRIGTTSTDGDRPPTAETKPEAPESSIPARPPPNDDQGLTSHITPGALLHTQSPLSPSASQAATRSSTPPSTSATSPTIQLHQQQHHHHQHQQQHTMLGSPLGDPLKTPISSQHQHHQQQEEQQDHMQNNPQIHQNHYQHRRSIERGPPRAPALSEPSHVFPDTANLVPLILAVPARYRESDLRLVYSTLRDGASLRAFFDKCHNCTSPVFLAVRDKGNAVFGAFITEPKWSFKSKHHGSGESFCYTLKPNIAIYTWSHKNKYFQRATPESIAIGGGGAFAISLGDMFERGTSGPCETYDSPMLSSTDQFEVTVFEAWELISRHS